MNIPIVNYLAAFLGGVAVSFSPCVLPLVPITLSIIGVKSGTSRLRAFFLSFIYVLGIATTYSILGIIASLSANVFGAVSTHPLAYIITGSACIIAGLTFLGVFKFHATLNFSGGMPRQGLPVFLLGSVSGLIVSPCTAPVLGTILLYVATKQNLFYGASLLFVFAIGMGTVLLLAGLFSGIVAAITRARNQVAAFEKACGFALIIIGEYFIFKSGRLMC